MEPLGLSDVALLVGMVKTGGRSGTRWSMKARVILALATFTDGDWFNAPDVEHLTGIPRAMCRRILLELEGQRVITRDGGDAAQPRRFWCEVNPDWRRWEVEWSAERRVIEQRLARAHELWAIHPLERLFSRPASARFPRVFALLSARAFQREKALWLSGIAPPTRAIPDRVSRATGARKTAAWRKEVSLLVEPESEASSSSVTARAKALEEEGRQHPGWGTVYGAYCARVGTRALWGAPASALARLVASYGPGPVLEAIDQAPAELGVGLLVDHLGQALACPEAVATVTPIAQGIRLAHLEQLVATYAAEGAEAPESLLSELARWQDGQEAVEEA